MAENSKIEWTQHTFNPWMGCTKVSEGCKFCYAERDMDHRWAKTKWGPRGLRVVTSNDNWAKPRRWDAAAAIAGERHRVFCASLADVFEGPETMPPDAKENVDAARNRLFSLIQATPNLDWLLLTKRPENVNVYVPGWVANGFPGNVWIGTSVENQAAADARIPHLLKTPARVRFLSCEPLLGPVDLTKYFKVWKKCDVCKGSGYFGSRDILGAFGEENQTARNECFGCSKVVNGRLRAGMGGAFVPALHWVIAGGESGPSARPMHPDWARSLRDQCSAARVPFLFKQWGENDATGARVGKHNAGRELDRRLWDEYPATKDAIGAA